MGKVPEKIVYGDKNNATVHYKDGRTMDVRTCILGRQNPVLTNIYQQFPGVKVEDPFGKMMSEPQSPPSEDFEEEVKKILNKEFHQSI